MGPLKVVHIPRLQRTMRGNEEPYLRRPFIQKVQDLVPPTVTPWWYSSNGMGALDLEYGASMQPRNNPAFNDTWLIGATGGANRVIPQGIDYSRTPCCVPNGVSGLGGVEGVLGVGLGTFIGFLLGGAVMYVWCTNY